jgi:hypothetical protein
VCKGWLEQHEKQPGEESPLGLILCAGKSEEHVELLEFERNSIRVAECMTELPPRKTLERRLHQALRAAFERFNRTLYLGRVTRRHPPLLQIPKLKRNLRIERAILFVLPVRGRKCQ